MKIYLAGPMRGYTDFNRAAFHKAAEQLRSAGHTVFSPSENDTETLGVKATNKEGSEKQLAKTLKMTELELRRKVFKMDTAWICDHAEAICLLPGWEDSKGATAEWALARALGLTIWYTGIKP